jgi:hypothetical protein
MAEVMFRPVPMQKLCFGEQQPQAMALPATMAIKQA